MRNKFKFNFLLILLISLGACSNVSDEAIKAGFKSDTDYQNHQEELRVKRDSSFKENILYATNLSAFDNDSQYEAAVYNLEKNLRKYISQNGSNYKLLHASSVIIDLNEKYGEISQIFISSHIAARKLVNSDLIINNSNEAEILFDKLLLDILNEI